MNGVAYYKLTDGDKLLDPPKLVTLQNLLPFEITVLLIQGDPSVGQRGAYKPLIKLGAKETKTIPYPPVDYEIYLTSVMGNNIEGEHLTFPIKFGFSSRYYFGGVAWNSFEMDTNMYNLYADLPGIRVINHFPFPVYVQYKNLSFTIPHKSWRDYEGGSPAQVYFDNQGWGLDVGEVFSVKALDNKLYDFKIPNRFVRNIHIGMSNSA